MTKKTKILILLLVLIGIVFMGIGTALFIVNTENPENEKNQPETEEKEQNNLDSTIEMYGISCTDHKFIKKAGKNYFQITIQNQRDIIFPEETIRIVFYNKEKEIGYIDEGKIPTIQPNQQVTVEYEYNGEVLLSNYEFKIELVSSLSEIG